MLLKLLLVNLLLLCKFANLQLIPNNNELEGLMGPFRRIKLDAFDMLFKSVVTKENMDKLHKMNKLQKFSTSKSTPCPLNNTKSPSIPQSVHSLRPGDIQVIGALGDSISAGVGLMATNLWQVALEFRGFAHSAGGEGTWRKYLTLPNILKTFNKHLTGYATTTSLTLHKFSQLNLAETGAVSEDMPYMARMLVNRIQNHPKINVENDWKMITFMIGPNNFCSQICYESNLKTALDKHKHDLLDVLRTLRDNLPRTIVNLIPAPNLKILLNFTGRDNRCILTHIVECPCLFGPASQNRQGEFIEFMSKWQQLEIEIADKDEFDLDHFTVVVQPFTLNFTMPTLSGTTDYSYLSEDCFHFSQKGNALIANSLWNNILEPVGSKSLSNVKQIGQIKCPSLEQPFIFTRRNSN